jgi:ATP-dependent Clp protease ATP-binding subunit ClpA
MVNMAELIAQVRHSTASEDPLDLLAMAIAQSEELTANADALVDHFVADARQAGHSWTAIGERLGVSKQAVRERFAVRATLAGRERFMPRLQQCVTAAGSLAQRQGSEEITLTHLIVALASNEGVAANALYRLGVTPDKVSLVAGPTKPARSHSTGAPPSESEAFRDALRGAALFAIERGHNYVGTEHVLFVLATDPGSSARRVLEQLDVDVTGVKRELAQCVGGRVTQRRRRDRRARNCSFCGTSSTQLCGPGVGICAGCARLAVELDTR